MRSSRVVVVVLACLLLAGVGLGLVLLDAPAALTAKDHPAQARWHGVTVVPSDPAPTESERDDGYVKGWGRPVWRDEFDGSSLDTSRWNVRDKDRVSYDVATIYARQARVHDGKLVLRAQRVDPAQDAFGSSWQTAYLDTTGGKFSQRYGRFEMSAKLPTSPGDSRGMWPSFWLRDDKGPGEIDIMEAWGEPTSRPRDEEPGSYTWTVHRDTYDSSQEFSGAAVPKDGPGLSDGFHRYAAEWTPQHIRFFLDGTEVGEVDTTDHPWLRTSFPSGANIRLQLAVGSEYWGFPDRRTKSPADYVIDYVRVWSYRGR